MRFSSALQALAFLAIWPLLGLALSAAVSSTRGQVPRARFLVKEKTVELVLPRGRLVGRTVATEYIELARLPPAVTEALIYQEDRSFFRHRGYSLRELVSVVLGVVLFDQRMRGASTITQQIARTLFLSRQREVVRKLREARIAAILERSLSKERILELYLNHVYFGRNLHGIEAAARFYFGRSATRLTNSQVAYLVSLLPSPDSCPPRVACARGGQDFRYHRNLRRIERTRAKTLSAPAGR